MSKLFVVSVTIEQLVIAEDENEAKQLGVKACRDESLHEEDMEVSLASYIPGNWDGECMVFHNGNMDITVDEAIKTCEHSEHRMNRRSKPVLFSPEKINKTQP
jgi:hypothetical protein